MVSSSLSESQMFHLSFSEEIDVVGINPDEAEDSPPQSMRSCWRW